MSSYVKRAMQSNERILCEAQLHWIIYKMGLMIVLIGTVLAFWTSPLIGFLGEDFVETSLEPTRYVALGLIAVGAFQLVCAFIRQISTELVITDRRVIAKHGFISTTSYELMLPKVEGATIDQSILGRILGYGTIMVKGTGGGISPIDHVTNPYLFHAHLMSALQKVQDSTMDHGIHD
ncbi:MAG: PH domain-containing protein [Alphaproteobacteria bacterium]|nr:PH domain-containing protein [Alphaproteobacteria bacterium]